MELYPDGKEQGKIGTIIGRRKGLQDVYDGLIGKRKEPLHGGIEDLVTKPGQSGYYINSRSNV